jgi:hypothetical protein
MTARRRLQAGQVVPIAAIFTAVILGGVALAVDLGLGSHRHRNLQNAADAAALSGARDLGKTSVNANQTDRDNAVVDALRMVYDHMGWGSAGTTWANNAVNAQTGLNCKANPAAVHCDVTTTGPGAFSTMTVTVNVPPLTARNSAYNETSGSGLPWGYVQVDVTERDSSAFGGVIGVSQETTGGHSIAYHFPGGQPFGFSLYSNSVVLSGNQSEIIQGNVYSYRNIAPQSNGQAGVCADTDSYGNPGHIVLGAPQSGAFPTPDPAAGAAYQHNLTPTAADVITKVTSCSSISGGNVGQTANLGSCGSLTVSGVPTLSTTQDPTSLACMANPPVVPPDIQGPSNAGNVVRYDGSTLAAGQSVLTVAAALTPGLYFITHNPNCVAPGCTDVVINSAVAGSCTGSMAGLYDVCMQGVTFWLDKGATIGIGNKVSALISPYVPPSGSSQDPNDGTFPIYAPLGSAAGVYITNIGTNLTATGTVYMPTGTMSLTQNATINIQGQVIVNQWNVQSGNHLNPEVTYVKNTVAAQREVLQTVE